MNHAVAIVQDFSNTMRAASIRNSQFTSLRSALNPSTVFSISVSACSPTATNRALASVRNAPRSACNNGIASRTYAAHGVTDRRRPQACCPTAADWPCSIRPKPWHISRDNRHC